jgi:UDP:flavonoid glycosyltransferase YjiC (YdhE family)
VAVKILCIASAGTGHLDFGGMGFVKLARSLMARGHEVAWISSQHQAERLRSMGFSAESQPVIDTLSLNFFVPVRSVEHNRQRYSWLLLQMKSFHSLITSRGPDLILFDRLLAYAAMVAEELTIPYVSIGTPGGHWCLDESGTHPSDAPVQKYFQLGAAISTDLGWRTNSLGSFWVNSPQLNICFVGKDFYGPRPGIPSATVHHFSQRQSGASGTRFGISFGNQGNESILKMFMECLIPNKLVREPLDIFVGNNAQLINEFQARFQDNRIQFHGWVDFSRHFPELKCLAFFGGIGTIWHCIDNFLPMLVVPGMVGDQLYNGRIVSDRGWGQCFPMRENSCESLRPIVVGLTAGGAYQEGIAALRSIDNYSDTMETVCERLERL